MRSRLIAGIAALALALMGCAATDDAATSTTVPTTSTQAPPDTDRPLERLATEVVATGLSVPVWATSPTGSDRLFVVEQTGTIREIIDGAPAEDPYLDVTRFVTSEGLEQGLLGLAFHPDFSENRRAFISFTNVDGDTRVMEYLEDLSDPSRLDPGTGRLVIAVDQPHQYHNGGMIRFGSDGMLWLGLGDGGGIGDTYQNGQNPHTLLGTLVRIDVDGPDPGYLVPQDNPFVDGVDGAPEVYAYGLRNPWQFSFDGPNVFIADVGQEGWEEVNVLDIPDDAGTNFGWSVMEGPDCYHKDEDRKGDPCDKEGLQLPRFIVEHRRACAIVGGLVYRGAAIPELDGKFFYGDYCVGWVRSLDWDGEFFTGETDWSDELGDLGQIAALAEDAHGELLVLSMDGTVRRIVPVR